MKSCSQALNDVLDANIDIPYKKAHSLILDKYNLNLTLSNFHKIKSLRRHPKESNSGNNGKKIAIGGIESKIDDLLSKLKKDVAVGVDDETPKYTFTAINDEMIAKMLLDRINSGSLATESLIKTCITFYKDVKGDQAEYDRDFDFEKMLTRKDELYDQEKDVAVQDDVNVSTKEVVGVQDVSTDG